MPELPEVETSARGIRPHIMGKQVSKIIVRESRLRWPVPLALTALLPQQIIHLITRRGKYILLRADMGTLIVHLGMSGSLRILDSYGEPTKHDHVDIIFTDATCLRFNDPRRFGLILWTEQDPLEHFLLKSLGPEPLTSSFDSDYLFALSRGRSTPIKNFIMDSKIVVGVGNIYANESLHYAGIHPEEPAKAISYARYFRLVEIIKQILMQAIEIGGTTIRNFSGSDGKPGYFKQLLRVYGRAGLGCVACGITLIELRVGQRSSVYCPQCQARR